LYGHTVWIFTTIERKNAESVLRCAREPFDTAGLLEVPQWMFDPVACCRMTSATSPAVSCEALRELKYLLAQAPAARQRGMVQAEHHPCSVQEVLMRRQTSPQPGAQLDLFHPFPKTPQWTHLPQEVRQEAVRPESSRG